MIRLLIANNHPVVCEGLKQIFARASDIEVAAEAENGEETLQQVRDGTFDLLLLCMNIQDISSIGLIGLIHACRPDLPILVCTIHNKVETASCALKAGARGIITKGSKPEQWLEAVRTASSGDIYIDPAVAGEMAISAISPNPPSPHTLLSGRELEVFYLLVNGFGGNEIAEQLSFSNKTVNTYKTKLMKKMGLNNVADIVRYALRHKLTD